MATSNPVPVLGTQGFVSDSVTKFSTLMAHLYESDASQSQLYPDKVYSLAKILEDSGSDMSMLQNNMKNKLTTYFASYYETSSVNVNISKSLNSESSVIVQLDIHIEEKGQAYNSAWQFIAKDNVINKVINLNNTGSLPT